MRKIVLAILFLFPCAFSGISEGAIIPISDNNFFELSLFQFDTLEGFIVNSTPLDIQWEGTGLEFYTPSWSGEIINPYYSFASGTDRNILLFRANFSNEVVPGLVFDVLVWNEGSLIEQNRLTYVGEGGCFGWVVSKICPPDPYGYDRNPVPVPASVVLLFSGLGLITLLRRKSWGK